MIFAGKSDKSAKIGKDRGNRTRDFTFTRNLSDRVANSAKEPEGQKEIIRRYLEDVNELHTISYAVCGWEVAPTTGKRHLQGYVYFKNPLRWAGVVAALGAADHIERARASAAQNRVYCTKSGVFVELGVLPQQGKRTDLVDMRERMKSGEPLCKVIETCTSYQAMRGAELLQKYVSFNATKKQAVEVFWFWGPTGSGKTFSAYKLVEERKLEDDLWVSHDTLKWFDGYGGQTAVIFDDLRRDDVNFNFLLRLLDGYPIRAPIKGGFVIWKPKLIIITAPMDPASFAPCTENSRQLTRRINVSREFKERKEEENDKNIVEIE